MSQQWICTVYYIRGNRTCKSHRKMARKGLNFKIQIIDLVQEPPPPPVQEKGRIRSGFQEAMQNHKDDTQTQRNRHNTESTRGADKHIEAPRIHPFYSTFNLKTGPAASTGKRRNCHICPKHSTVFKPSELQLPVRSFSCL